MDVERFDICSRLAYCFEVCSTRLLAPTLASDIIIRGKFATEDFMFKGKQNALHYFDDMFEKEKKHKHPYCSHVITTDYFYGITIGRLTRKHDSKVLTVLYNANKIEVMKIHDTTVIKSMTVHPYPFFSVAPNKHNFLELCQIAVEDYIGLSEFKAPDESRKSSWVYVFKPLYEFLKTSYTIDPFVTEFKELYESCPDICK